MTRPDSVHHHGILAGVSAGAMGVLAAFGLVLLAWHRIAGAVGEAGIVIVWAVAAAVVGSVLAAAVFVFLLLRHRVLHPETLARPHQAAAEVLSSTPRAIPAQPAGEMPAAIEPPRVIENHFHFPDAEAAAAAVHAMQERER